MHRSELVLQLYKCVALTIIAVALVLIASRTRARVTLRDIQQHRQGWPLDVPFRVIQLMTSRIFVGRCVG